MSALTLNQLQTIMPRAGNNAAIYLGPINAAAGEFAINTPQRMSAWLAQLAVESADLTVFEEDLHYEPVRLFKEFSRHFPGGLPDAQAVAAKGPNAIANRIYASRMGNGDEASGDGWRYRGQGPAQLTGKNEFAACGEHLQLDLVAHPERVLDPLLGMRSAGWFWMANRCPVFADKGDINGVSHAWNGGLNGAAERAAVYLHALHTFGV